jgi:acetyltransferase-like isoleucine patch superfamily enzyme
VTVAYRKTQAAVTKGGSALFRYQEVVIGRRSLLATVGYEWRMLFKNTPGALGLFLRRLFWPGLFGFCGEGVLFGEGLVLRHPGRIRLGDRVVIGEGCVLDARSDGTGPGLALGDDVILSVGVSLTCKGGSIAVGDRTGFGTGTIIQSIGENPVVIGDDVILGPRCYVVGGASYRTDRLDLPIRLQGIADDGGVTIGNDVWLGANVTVLGGVTVGSGAVAAAGAVVTHDLPELSVAMGIPARTVRIRGEKPDPSA